MIKKKDSNLIIMIIILSILPHSVVAQVRSIHGLIIDDTEFEGQCCVSIYIDDTVKIGETSMDGTFQMTIPLETKEITLYGPNVYPTKIRFNINYDNKLEIIMLSLFNYDISPKKAEERVRKRYNKLKELYKKAYLQGIFNTYTHYFQQIYIPFYSPIE